MSSLLWMYIHVDWTENLGPQKAPVVKLQQTFFSECEKPFLFWKVPLKEIRMKNRCVFAQIRSHTLYQLYRWLNFSQNSRTRTINITFSVCVALFLMHQG